MSPPIFVMVLEWQHKTLRIAMHQKGFHVHPGCKPLNLGMLSFADHLLLFCKADLKSVALLRLCFTTLLAIQN